VIAAMTPQVLWAATPEGGSTNVLLPQTGELIVGIIVFALIVAAFYSRAVPAIRKIYAERTDTIEGGIRRAEQAQAEAQRTLEAYRAQLAEARAESGRIVEEANRQGAAIRAEAERGARESADRIVAAAHAQAETDRQSVVTQLRRELGELGLGLAERIVGVSLASDDTQRRVIDDFIAGVERSADAERAGAVAAGTAV